MFICRMFHRDNPFEQLETRLIGEGCTTIGRDPDADWSIGQADPRLSRIHCTLNVEDGRLYLEDCSSNGTFLADGRRVARGAPVELAIRQSFHLGATSIFVDRLEDRRALDEAVMHGQAPVSALRPSVAGDWDDGAPPARPAHPQGSLIDAFCQGAKLDASALSSEDPVELMTRVGAIYQQAVLGLAALMSDRARLKSELHLERTTISAADNNPFKWASTRKLAQDLLCESAPGFLSGPEAVRVSFEDLVGHLAAVAEGADASTELTLRTFAPEAIDAEARSHGALLKSRPAVCWEIFRRRYASLTKDGSGECGDLKRAFAEAYGRLIDASPRGDAPGGSRPVHGPAAHHESPKRHADRKVSAG